MEGYRARTSLRSAVGDEYTQVGQDDRPEDGYQFDQPAQSAPGVPQAGR